MNEPLDYDQLIALGDTSRIKAERDYAAADQLIKAARKHDQDAYTYWMQAEVLRQTKEKAQ